VAAPAAARGPANGEQHPHRNLAELVTAGEPMQFVADTYGFTLAEVQQAVAYETTRRRAA